MAGTNCNYRHNMRDSKGRFATKDPNTPSKGKRKRNKSKDKLDKLIDFTRKDLDAKPILNNICFVVDGSGSMQAIRQPVKDTLNSLGTVSYRRLCEKVSFFIAPLRE